MNNSCNTEKENSKVDYNEEPVIYCKNCLSLKIMNFDGVADYCDKCGCTNTDSTDIESWEKMYINKYGEPYTVKRYGRKEKRKYCENEWW